MTFSPTEQKRANNILEILAELYPDPRSELNFKNEYQLVVAVVLSAQCTDKKVNEVTPKLFRQCKDFKSLGAARISEIEKIIRPVNYYKTKAKHLKILGQIVEKDFSNKLPHVFDDLISLPGVGRKTASVIQCELGLAPAFPVDTHVFRVSQRLGLAAGKNPVQVEDSIKATFKPALWRNLHHWFIFHGRRVCKAQKPDCGNCNLSKYCPSSKAPDR